MDKFMALRVFARVVEHGGFTAAAARLGQSPSAVTKTISRLEDELGTQLFNRSTRRLRTTDFGQEFYERSVRILAELEDAEAAIKRGSGVPRGSIRAVLPLSFGRVPLEVALDAQQLAQGTWDVAIRTHPPADETIGRRLLGAPPALLCATPQYLQQRGTPERPDDLRLHDLLTPEASELPEFRLHLSRNAQRAEVPLSPKLSVDDPAVLHAAAAAGLGIGLLPEFLGRQGLATGRLKAVLPEWSVPPAAALYALYPSALESDARAQQFVDFLAANIVPALALPAARSAAH